MKRLVVLRSRISIKYLDDLMHIYPVLCCSNEDLIPLGLGRYILEDSDDDVIHSELLIRGRFWRVTKIKLPQQLVAASMAYFNEFHKDPRPWFDCYVFALIAHNNLQQYVHWNSEQWEHTPLRFRPKVGLPIFLTQDTEEGPKFVHAAIYIGKGFYLSVYGGGGLLVASTLRDMKHDYKADNVLIGRLRDT